MKEKLIMVILVFSLTVNAAAFITIGYFWGKNNRSREAGPSPLSAELSLDQDQRDRMRELRKSFIQETAPVRDELMVKRAELAQLLASAGPERASLDQKIREINELQLKMQMSVMDQLFKEKAFLRPEQQARYADFVSHRLCQDFLPGRKGHRGARGWGMGPRGGREGRWDDERRMHDRMTRDQ